MVDHNAKPRSLTQLLVHCVSVTLFAVGVAFRSSRIVEGVETLHLAGQHLEQVAVMLSSLPTASIATCCEQVALLFVLFSTFRRGTKQPARGWHNSRDGLTEARRRLKDAQAGGETSTRTTHHAQANAWQAKPTAGMCSIWGACHQVFVRHGRRMKFVLWSDCQAHRKKATRNDIPRRCCSIRMVSNGNRTCDHTAPVTQKNFRKMLFNVKLWELRPVRLLLGT